MKVARQCSALLFYSMVFMLFFIDLASLSLFEKPYIYSLLSFYILQLAYPITFTRIITCCLLLSIAPLINYGRFGLELIYVIPATLIGIKMSQTLYDSVWQYYLLLIACLIAQIGLLEYFILHLNVSIPYTISTIFANLIVIWLMTILIKLETKGKQRKYNP